MPKVQTPSSQADGRRVSVLQHILPFKSQGETGLLRAWAAICFNQLTYRAQQNLTAGSNLRDAAFHICPPPAAWAKATPAAILRRFSPTNLSCPHWSGDSILGSPRPSTLNRKEMQQDNTDLTGHKIAAGSSYLTPFKATSTITTG